MLEELKLHFQQKANVCILYMYSIPLFQRALQLMMTQPEIKVHRCINMKYVNIKHVQDACFQSYRIPLPLYELAPPLFPAPPSLTCGRSTASSYSSTPHTRSWGGSDVCWGSGATESSSEAALGDVRSCAASSRRPCS